MPIKPLIPGDVIDSVYQYGIEESFANLTVDGHHIHIKMLREKIAQHKSEGKDTKAMEAKLDRHVAAIKSHKHNAMREDFQAVQPQPQRGPTHQEMDKIKAHMKKKFPDMKLNGVAINPNGHINIKAVKTVTDTIKESEMNELDEARVSKQHPIEGHPYHSKSEAELRYIIKDAGEAARAMKDHSPHAESKYLDQVNDASTVLSYRKRNGTPDWYKQKYKLKEETELAEAMKPLPRRHFFQSYGVEGHGIAHDGKENHWKFENNKPVAHTKDPEVVDSWKRELAAKSRTNEETELDEGIKSVVHNYLAKRSSKKADDAYDIGDEAEFQKQVDKSEYHRVKAGGKPTRINKNPDAKFLTTREEVELDESVKIIDRDSDLDQEHFKLSVNGKPVHFVHHNYEGGHATDSKQDIHYQVKNQLKHLSDADKKKVTNAVHASYRIKEEVELDEGSIKSLIRSKLLGNIRTAAADIKHGNLEKLHRDAGQDEAADRHARAQRRIAKAYQNAQMKEDMDCRVCGQSPCNCTFIEDQLNEGKVDKSHPIVQEYDALKKHDIKTLRGMIRQQQRIVDTSEFRTKDHAISHYLRNKHGNKKVDQAFGFNEEVELEEVAKPKGIVDKNVGKPPKESKSGFKIGQRVAHYRGMGKTAHGNVTNPDAVSGGVKGAMVKFAHGSEFVPHKELKDSGQYWNDEQDKMYKERKEEVELGEEDELSQRPQSWRPKNDPRVKKDGKPTKFELGMQDNLKQRIKFQQNQGGLTGPKGNLPEEVQLDEISSMLRDKVKAARFKAFDDSQRSTGKWLPKSGDPEKLKKLQRNTKLNGAHFKRTVLDKLPKMTNQDYIDQAEYNRKRGWSNESTESDIEATLVEAIKGWKNAHSDIMRNRAEQSASGNSVVLHSLKKDGKESGMHDARKTFRSEDEALEYHKRVRGLNPTRNIRHNMYVDGKMVKTLED